MAQKIKGLAVFLLVLGATILLISGTNNAYADSKRTDITKISANKLINKADKNKLKNGLYKTNVAIYKPNNKNKNSYIFIAGSNHERFKLHVTKKQFKKILDVTHAKINIKSTKTNNGTKLTAEKINISNTAPDSKKNQTYSDVVIDQNKLNSLSNELQNGNTGDFIDEYTAMTIPEQSKYYRALVDEDLTVTIKGSAFNIQNQGNKMMVYAGKDIPGTNITQPVQAEDYFQFNQKEHKIFRVETNGNQFFTLNPMDDVTISGKLDRIATLYQKDKMDDYFKLTDA
jgi:hypothetical protein